MTTIGGTNSNSTPNMAAPTVLECPICNDQYGNDHNTTPRVLGCGHTYCTRCLTQLVSAQRGKKCGVKCAFCNHLHELLRPDPTLIAANHAVIEIIKLGDIVIDDGPKCEYKGPKCTGNASWVCFDCNFGTQTLFCDKCVKAEHERQFGPVRRHRRTPMAQLSDPQTSFCSWHPKTKATLYSVKQKKFACEECNLRSDFPDQKEDFDAIPDATKELRSQAKRLVQYSQDVLARLNQMLQMIAADNAALGPSVQQAKTQITEKFASITNIVQERQQVLIDRVETEFDQRKERMEEQLMRIKKAFTELNAAQSSLNSTLGKNDVDFLFHYETVFSAMEKVLSEEDRSLQRIVSYRDIPFFIPQNITTDLNALGAVGGGSVPYDLRCETSSVNSNLMRLTWQVHTGPSEIKSYEIEAEYLPNTAETGLRGSKVQNDTYYNTEPHSVIISGNVLGSHVDNLVPGCRYRFRIRSQNAAGWGIWSDSVIATCEPFPINMSTTRKTHKIRIPRDGFYRMTAKGAKGADGRVHYGGRGAIITATFELKAGDILFVLVGCQSTLSVCNTGGGGGTFVAVNEISDKGLLLAAGGGGGTRGLEERDQDGCDANLDTCGTDGKGLEIGKGGLDGEPGEDANSEEFMGPCWGYGGAGFLHNSSTARSFANGGAGGQYGGFGGGGAVGLYGGGGGGGYSGGGGGRGGGGGGSYVKETAMNVSKKVGNEGHGMLVVEIVDTPIPVEEFFHATNAMQMLESSRSSEEQVSTSSDSQPQPQPITPQAVQQPLPAHTVGVPPPLSSRQPRALEAQFSQASHASSSSTPSSAPSMHPDNRSISTDSSQSHTPGHPHLLPNIDIHRNSMQAGAAVPPSTQYSIEPTVQEESHSQSSGDRDLATNDVRANTNYFPDT